MAQLLNGTEFIKVLQYYNCHKFINDQLTRIILDMKVEHGTMRQLVEVTDCRERTMFSLRRMEPLPNMYFDAAFDFRWIRARKIVIAGQVPEQDRLSIGCLAAESLNEEEFAAKLEAQAMDQALTDALKVINPK